MTENEEREIMGAIQIMVAVALYPNVPPSEKVLAAITKWLSEHESTGKPND